MRTLFQARPGALLVVLFGLTLGLAACTSRDPVARGQATVFGNRIDITLIGINRRHADEVTQTLADEFSLMEAAWLPREHGPLTRINTLFNAGSDAFAAPPSLLPLIALSKRLSGQSDGLFNPAIGHLTRAWGFDGNSIDCFRPPTEEVIDAVLSDRPSMGDIRVDGFRIWSEKQTVRLDFRDIRRGYAIDRAIARLQEMGIHSASISVDGNVRAIGSRDGNPWSHAIRGPDGGGVFATLEIQGNEAAFTAGNYQNDFTWDGKVYHDILDPRTGYPASKTASVTVLHPSASTADAAATALFIAGPQDWHRIARQMGVRYVMLTDVEGRVHMNPAMMQRIKLQRDNREVIISQPLS